MSADLSLKIDTPAESIEALAKEAECLKAKLEEERQKLNDVARKYFRCNLVLTIWMPV